MKLFFQKKRIVLTWAFAALLAFCVLFSASRWEDVFLVSDILFLVGIFLVAIATVGRLWCSLYISGYKSASLVTTGPYSMCRNPLYFFSLLGAVGVGCASEAFTIAGIILVAFALYYPLVIAAEESKLRQRHGQAFASYFADTPRFLPSFARLREPEEYTVKPLIFRKRLLDSLCFVWLVGALEIVESLHEYHLIPVLFRVF